MKKVLEEAQRMKDQLQRDLGEMRISATAGGGAITATVNGQKDLLELSIDPDVVDPSDIEMLQDLVVAAIGNQREIHPEVDTTSATLHQLNRLRLQTLIALPNHINLSTVALGSIPAISIRGLPTLLDLCAIDTEHSQDRAPSGANLQGQ